MMTNSSKVLLSLKSGVGPIQKKRIAKHQIVRMTDIFLLYQSYAFQFLLFLPLEMEYSIDNVDPGLLVGERYTAKSVTVTIPVATLDSLG